MRIANVFDPAEETEPDWAEMLRGEMVGEFAKFGPVVRCVVDVAAGSAGHVYVVFQGPVPAATMAAKMHGRFFAKRQLTAAFVTPADVDKAAAANGDC